MLKHLPEMLQAKALNRVMLKAAAPVVREAVRNVRPYSRKLALTVKAWQPRKRKNAVVFIGPKKQKLRDLDVRYAHLTEFGSRGIIEKSRGTNYTKSYGDGNDKFRFISHQVGVGGRYRKDQPAKPFMYPAWQSKVNEVRRILNEDTADLLMKEIQKKAYRI